MKDLTRVDSIIENMSNSIGLLYMGDWLIDYFNDKELKDEIHKRADLELVRIINKRKNINNFDKVIIISLIYIALEHYNGSFYEHVEGYYPKTFEMNYSDQYITNKIREIIRSTYDVNSDYNQRIINEILVQSFVPIEYLDDFFEFIADIHRYNYDYYLFDEDDYDNQERLLEIENDLIEIFDVIFNESSSNNIENDNVTTKVDNRFKSYRLIVSTKIALSEASNVQAVMPIVTKIIKIINNDFWGRDNSKLLSNRYYKIGFDKWKKTKTNSLSLPRAGVGERKKGNVLQPYYSHYNYSANSIFINTRVHNLNGSTTKDVFKVQIFNGDALIKEILELSIYEGIGTVRINSLEIELDGFLSELSYRLLKNDEVIFNSGRYLYRQYLMFKNTGEYLRSTDNYAANAYIFSVEKIENISFIEKKFKNYYRYKGWLDKNSLLNFGDDFVVTKNVRTYEMFGENAISVKAHDSQHQKIEVYKDLKNVTVRISDIETKNLFFTINSENIRILDNHLKKTRNEYGEFLSINLASFKLNSGYYDISLNSGSNTTPLASFKFILDRDLEITEAIKDYSVYCRSLKSFFFDDIRVEQKMSDLKTDEIKSFDYEFTLSSEKFTYFLQPEIEGYSLGEKNYHFSRHIWVDDLDDNLSLNFKSIDKVEIKKARKVLKTLWNQEKCDEFLIDKNEILNLKSTKVKELELSVFSNKLKYKISLLFRNKIYSSQTNIIYEANKHYFSIKYDGKNSLDLVLKINNKVEACRKKIIQSGNYYIPIKEDVFYTIEVFEGELSPFSRTQKECIFKQNYMRPSLKSILAKEIVVLKAYIDQSPKPIEISKTRINRLSVKENQIVGHIYYENNVGLETYLDKINPVSVFLTEDLIQSKQSKTIRTVVEITDFEGDGLGANIRKKIIEPNYFGDLPDPYKYEVMFK